MPGVIPEGSKRLIKIRTIRKEEQPEDLVGTAIFLVSEGSDFITGQSIIIDGGAVFQ
jgi:3-oxoacyl-[acyl-carrier protein] reductase